MHAHGTKHAAIAAAAILTQVLPSIDLDLGSRSQKVFKLLLHLISGFRGQCLVFQGRGE
jgi:hypothetical protein